ncbi:glycerophosphodiester phosphodiesterase family protein [Leptolyngbya sp. BL0902]|uniref:glycerophosphodiester phosphodiesterase family protein n=1 Tax=Leptolyngbya sp. BL0902 TaxID=1115757 RepID=UPI0018E6FBF4|nr:glycerophosphodiester phosphodiesterase family protein [Leptolyngbya sp. BL0902]
MDWITARPIAHRGLHQGKTVPENSLLAFDAAIAQGFPIEMDIQLLADGELAVFHDKTLDRLTGQPGIIHHQTLASLKHYRLYDTDERIPSLAEALDVIDGRVPALIEIKNEGRVGALERALLKTLTHYQGEFAVQSFNPLSLQWFKHHAPHIQRGQLSSAIGWEPAPRHLALAHSNLLFNWASQPHFIAYDLRSLPKLSTTVAKCAFHIPLITWTVRSPSDQAKAQSCADNYIFDPF